MKKSKTFIALIFLLLPLSGLAQTNLISKVENSLIPAKDNPEKKTFTIQERMEQLKVPGLSIAVINNYSIEWAKGYGIKDVETGEMVSENTLFQAASISKPVAAMAALRLVEEGVLDLETDVNTYLSSWKIPENSFTETNKVTLKGIVSHTAGLTVHGFRGYKESEDRPTVIQILEGKHPSNSQPVLVNKTPGSEWKYSGGGYTVMQVVLEDVAGKKFKDLLREKVISPIGMNYSTYEQPLGDGVLRFAASGHTNKGEPVREKRHIYPELAAAGLWTTPSDLAKFVIEIQLSLQGKSNVVLTKDMTRKMLTVVNRGYSLGFAIHNVKDGKGFGHGGSNAGFRCVMVGTNDGGKGIVVMTNGDSGSRLYGEIMDAVRRTYNW